MRMVASRLIVAIGQMFVTGGKVVLDQCVFEQSE